MNKSQTKEYRRNQSKKWRLAHGVPTVDGLERTCRQCKGEFYPKNIRALCCSKRCAKDWNKENRVRPTAAQRVEERLNWNHGLSVAEWSQLFTEQKDLCKMCGQLFDESVRELRPCLDHDHKCCRVGASCVKCRRGFIHQRCNLVLGHAKDDAGLLRKAASYLEEHNAL